MTLSKVVLSLLFFSLANPSFGIEIAYQFQGTVTTTGTVFSHSIPAGSVSGHFAYNTSSSLGVPIPGFPSTRYVQHRTDGLLATFGATQFVADDYFVVVSDNINQPTVGIVDEFEIYFQGNQGLATPVEINGNSQNPLNGLLRVALRFPASTFTSQSLPLSLNSLNLVATAQAKLSPVNDNLSGTGLPDARFRVNSFSVTTLPPEAVAAPEPGSAALMIAALLAGTLCCLRIGYRSFSG